MLSKLRSGQRLSARVTGKLVTDSRGSTYAILITDVGGVEGTVAFIHANHEFFIV